MAIRILIVILLLSSVAYGGDFLDSLDHNIVMVKQSLGYSSSSSAVDDSTVAKFIRDAYNIMAPALGAIDVVDTVISVQYQMTYAIDSLFLRVDAVYWKHYDSLKTLREIPSDSFSKIFFMGKSLRGEKDYERIPTYYSWKQGYIRFYPIPYEADDYFYVEGIGRVDNIMSDSAFMGDFPVTYRSVANTYATWRTAVSINNNKASAYWELLKFQAGALNLNINEFKIK